MEKRFELLPHTADIKMRAYGASLQELFSNALYGMFMSVEPQLTSTSQSSENILALKAENLSLLLVDFLSEALCLSAVHHEVYLEAVIDEITETMVKVTFKGYPINGFAVTEIKAVTYHDLEVVKVNNQWRATLVFDI